MSLLLGASRLRITRTARSSCCVNWAGGKRDVPVLFPMHFRDREMCESFVADVTAEGVSADVKCPTARGQRFVEAKGGRGR
jgi:hypothetical protein